jgi:hypothetical protein
MQLHRQTDTIVKKEKEAFSTRQRRLVESATVLRQGGGCPQLLNFSKYLISLNAIPTASRAILAVAGYYTR